MHGLHIAPFFAGSRAGADSGGDESHFLVPFWRPEVHIWSSWHLPELPEGLLLSTRHANDFSVNFGVRRGGGPGSINLSGEAGHAHGKTNFSTENGAIA